jgi:hypothetical protein
MSRFRISIVDTKTGQTASLVPGSTGERDFVASITEKVVRKGVGIFRTEAQVKAAIDAGVKEAIKELKREVDPHGKS